MYSEILHAFDSTSAPFMYAITLLLAYALTIIVERSYHYYFCWPQLLPFLEIKKQDSENTTTDKPNNEVLSKHPIHPFIQASSSQMSPDEYWKQVSKHAPLIEIVVKKRLSMLANIANIATMLGLLGTVYGLVYALGGLDEASLTERTARLSEGISTAMITTAWGLVVGVPALLAHGFLSSKATEILATCESYCAMRAPLPKVSTQEQSE